MPRVLTKTILWLLFLWQQPAIAQHLPWENFTTDQGLPGNIVYKSFKDSSGYLWFATDQGICRFNGYEFFQPADTSALRGSEAFVPTEDAQGRIWFARLDRSVWFIENDTVRAWKYNELTRPYREEVSILEQLNIAQDGSVWMALYGLGFLVVHNDGRHEVIAGKSTNWFMFSEQRGAVFYTSKSDLGKFATTIARSMKVLQWQNKKTRCIEQIIMKVPYHHTERGIWRLRNGDFIYSSRGTFYLIREGQILWEAPAKMLAGKIHETPAGEILIASHTGSQYGLFHCASIEHLRRGEFRNLLPNHFVTDIDGDDEGGWWATTHHAGVFYCKNPRIDIFTTDRELPSSDVSCLTTDGKATVFAGLRPSNIISINSENGQYRTLPSPTLATREVQTIFFDTLRQRLWCSDPLLFLNKNEWKPFLAFDPRNQRTCSVLAKKITSDLKGATYWTSAPYGFFKVEVESNSAVRLGALTNELVPQRTFSVTPDHDGNIWVTTSNGLRLWQDSTYKLPPFDHPGLHFQPRDVLCLPDGSLAISLRAAGILFRDKQGKFIHLTQRDGLTSDFISKLYAGPDGIVFACSNAGLNKITPEVGGGWRIETITVKEGLPSNQINDVVALGREIWVATNLGLARVRDLTEPFPMPVPILEKLLVNNKPSAFSAHLQLPHNENNLSIRFFTLHYRSGGNILYRYRLLGADTAFIYTRTRIVNFASLSPNTYTFEVQAQNEDRQWSEPARWSFEVRAAWWQTGWFQAAIALLSAAGLGLWYRNHLRKMRHESEVQNKIRELESAALRAQINPHFIFNCLGSIQHFISENDAASATRYLARFARLVRLALHGSVDGRHSLQEEIEMLENYLALEQLRFRGKFNYEIKAAPELELEDIFLPPMLVQPFVENALVHGMKNKTEGGQICIVFNQKGKFLTVIVTDNGPGFDSQHKNLIQSGHKSVGMTLTQHRLEILSGQAGQGSFTMTPVVVGGNQVIGNQVVLQIPIV